MTREQLERLAEKINAKWGIRVDARGPLPWLHFTQECFCFDTTDNDQDNATFIIWCLDRLEELGYCTNLDTAISGNARYAVRLGSENIAIAPTRAEALALALLAKLEEE